MTLPAPDVGNADRAARRRFVGPWLAPALALAAIGLAVATQVALTEGLDIDNVGVGFLVAICALGVAALFTSRGRIPRRVVTVSPMWELRLVIAVLGLAAFFRLHRFLEFPPGLWFDEAVNGTDAIQILERDHLTVWRETNYGHSTLYFYLLIASFRVFGFTVIAMRAVPVAAGLLAVAFFYLLSRKLVGTLPALGATALFGVSRYAVTFSRISWEASLQPLLEIMAVYFLFRALECGRRVDWLFAGGSLAAGLYTYVAFRIVPVVVVFLLLYAAATQWSLVRRHLAGLLLFVLSFVVVVAPLAQYAAQNPDQFLRRTREVSVFKQIDEEGSYAPLTNNLKATVEMLNVRGDPNGRHNLPGEPMLDELSAALLVLGAAVSLWSFRSWNRGFALGWLALGLLPSALTLTHENPSAIRAIGSLPPIFLLIALALEAIHRAVATNRFGIWTFASLAAVIVIASAGINYYDLFGRQAGSQAVYDSFQPSLRKAAELAHREADAYSVYVAPSFAGPALEVLTHGDHIQMLEPSRHVPLPLHERDALLILDPHQSALSSYLEALYPNLSVTREMDPYGRLEYIAVRVSAQENAALHTVRANYEGDLFQARVEPDLVNAWPMDMPAGLTFPFELTWRGVLDLRGEVQAIVLSSPGPIRFELVGVGRWQGEGSVVADVPSRIPLGLYRFSLWTQVRGPGTTSAQLRMSDGTTTSIPADAIVRDAPTDHGFLAMHFANAEWSGIPALWSIEPYAVPAARLAPKFSVAMEGRLEISEPGVYDWAVEAEWPVIVAIDKEIVVDASEPLGWRRVEGAKFLSAGFHELSIGYVNVGRTSFHVEWRRPGGDWSVLTGREVLLPPDARSQARGQ